MYHFTSVGNLDEIEDYCFCQAHLALFHLYHVTHSTDGNHIQIKFFFHVFTGLPVLVYEEVSAYWGGSYPSPSSDQNQNHLYCQVPCVYMYKSFILVYWWITVCYCYVLLRYILLSTYSMCNLERELSWGPCFYFGSFQNDV